MVSISEAIDLRSFSNLWFWIALAVLWSSASHWILGVPWDLVQRARRGADPAARDVETLSRIHGGRLLTIAREAGPWLVAGTACLLTSLGLLGFLYWIEFAQALLCLVLPMVLVGAMSLRLARRIETGGLAGEPLFRAMAGHRRAVQALGMVSIFVTAIWGMFQNLRIGPI